MRIAVVSDIHSNYDALKKVLEALSDYDSLFCLGDLVGYGAQPNEVVEEIRALKPEVVLMGNHDYAVVTGDTADLVNYAAGAIHWTRKVIKDENLRYLSNLSPMLRTEIRGYKVCLCHGSPRDPLNEYIFPGVPDFILGGLIEQSQSQILLLGHTHVPFVLNMRSKMIANPGSVGQPRDGDPRASYGILDIEEDDIAFQINRAEYDIASAASRIIQSSLPEFLGDRLFIGA